MRESVYVFVCGHFKKRIKIDKSKFGVNRRLIGSLTYFIHIKYIQFSSIYKSMFCASLKRVFFLVVVGLRFKRPAITRSYPRH